MNESQPSPTEDQKKQELKKYLSLSRELSMYSEGLSFPGVDEETLKKLKAVDEEYPGYTTPTDEIISKMKTEGIKIVFGEHPESGNVFVLPLLSDNIRMDSLFPRHLETIPEMDESLRSLILTHKKLFLESEAKEL